MSRSKTEGVIPTYQLFYQKYVVEGWTKYEIAQLCMCSHIRVQRLLAEYEIPTRSRSEAKMLSVRKKRGPTLLDDPEELRRLYIDEELSTLEIGGMIGVRHHAVSGQLRRYGIPVRDQIEAQRTSRYLSKARETKLGPRSPAWLGGISRRCRLRRTPGFTKAIKKKIRARDNHRCARCGARRKLLRALSVHHIDFDKNNHEESNLVTLCRSCHAIVHAHNIRIEVPNLGKPSKPELNHGGI